MKALAAFFQTLLSVVRRIAEISLAIMAVVTVIDVIGRYAFGRPVTGTDEIVQSLLLLAIFAGVPLATLSREHVTVDIITQALPPRAWRGQQSLGNAIAAVISVLLAAGAWRKTADLFAFGDKSMVIGIPLAPLFAFVTVMLAVNALVLIGQTIGILSGRIGPANG